MPLTKDDISRQMVEFFLNHLYMLALITMGGGKTKASLDCVVAKYGYKRKGMIVCHSVKSRDVTWPDEIKCWHPQLQEAIDKGFVKLIHKDHILKIPADWYDWIIWDECHLMKREHLQWIKIYQEYIKSLILMTGTETSDDYMKNNVRKLVQQAVLEFPTENAIDEGLINDYRVKAIELELPETDYTRYEAICKKITIAKGVSNSDWLQAVQGERLHFIYDHHLKIDIIQQLDLLLEYKRRLIFLTRKEFCAEVSEHIYHSSTKETDFILFARGDINKLASVKQLKTGTNIFNFDHIINQQFNSKYENFMQTLGRLFRLSPGQTGWIYAFYYKDTQDEAWFHKAAVKVPSHKKRIYNLNTFSLEEIIADTF